MKKDSIKFEISKAAGIAGEQVFIDNFKYKLIRLDGFKGDFSTKNNEKIELKTDYYDMEKTENFFIERYSDRYKLKNGGPWQAQDDGCKYYVYFFVKNKTYFIFDTLKLVEYLDAIIDKMSYVDIQNRDWVTSGYKIKRESLNHLLLNDSILI